MIKQELIKKKIEIAEKRILELLKSGELKKREQDSSGVELSIFYRQLKLQSNDGKYYETDCANTKNIFRIIQPIPSPKAKLSTGGFEPYDKIVQLKLS